MPLRSELVSRALDLMHEMAQTEGSCKLTLGVQPKVLGWPDLDWGTMTCTTLGGTPLWQLTFGAISEGSVVQSDGVTVLERTESTDAQS